jgi:hypothetical protein
MLALLSQIGVSLSILIVWTLRFNNVKSDFQKDTILMIVKVLKESVYNFFKKDEIFIKFKLKGDIDYFTDN